MADKIILSSSHHSSHYFLVFAIMARKDMGWYGILTLASIPGYGMGSRYEIPYH